jgi:hypothetical protein
MTYPHPADDTTGFAKPGYGDCDCCGKYRRLSFVGLPNNAGCETYACWECLGDDEDPYDE